MSLPKFFQMRSQQEHIRRIMDIKQIPYEEIDIADPKHKDDKLFMQDTLKLSDEDLKALPPQIFNDKKHRGVCNFKKLIC